MGVERREEGGENASLHDNRRLEDRRAEALVREDRSAVDEKFVFDVYVVSEDGVTLNPCLYSTGSTGESMSVSCASRKERGKGKREKKGKRGEKEGKGKKHGNAPTCRQSRTIQ